MTRIIALLFLAAVASAQDESAGCFTYGQCINSLFIGFVDTVSPVVCLEACQDYDNCRHFTHDATTNTCEFFANCDFSPNSCSTTNACISGDAICPAPRCDVDGLCQGTYIEVDDFVASDIACASECSSNTACRYWSYSETDNKCFLFRDCQLDDVIVDFSIVSGEKFCNLIPRSNCDDIDIDESGALVASPGYPNNYAPNEDCRFTVTAPVGTTITARFTFFDLESCCSCDSVELHDGNSISATLLDDVCYTDDPNTIYTTTGNQLFVYFDSDSSIQEGGYVLELMVNP